MDADGNYGYKKAGADTVTPFRSAPSILYFDTSTSMASAGNQAVAALGIIG